MHGEGRMLGSLVKYYRATGSPRALELALILKEELSEIYLEDGTFNQDRFGTHHAHSITCIMSSLAQLAELQQDVALLLRVKAFYDRGLWSMRDEIGWSPETTDQTESDHGEANNTGDMLETALILGKWGFPDCFHDAERILRCHLLPSQVRDISFIQDPPNPDAIDGLREVADRHLGSFGFPAPYGHVSVGKGRGNLSFNMDIVGGSVASLCEAYRLLSEQRATGHRINLLFDHQTAAMRLNSPYTHDSLRLELTKPGPLFVRIPPWVKGSELRIEGSDETPVFADGYLLLARPPVGTSIAIQFPLAEQEMTLSDRHHLQPIRVRTRGDSIVAMENFGAELTFFEPIE